MKTYYNLNYDQPFPDPFTQGRYTFYRPKDVRSSPMFRPLDTKATFPEPWEFVRYNPDKHPSYYQVPICRQEVVSKYK